MDQPGPQSNTYPITVNLRRKLVRALVSNHDGKKFLPCDRLGEFVTSDTVTEVFNDVGIRDAKSLIDFTLTSAKRLFLILVFTTSSVERISMLDCFRRNNIIDTSLPIEFSYDDESDDIICRTWTSVEAKCTRKFDGNYNKDALSPIIEDQWKLLSPVLGEGAFRVEYNERRILPYLDVAEMSNRSGYFGEVSRRRIHSAHIFLSKKPLLQAAPKAGVLVAVKTAKHGDELPGFFDREASNLHKIQEFDSHHLVEPITAYQINSDKCLVFPWADGGTLRDCWKSFSGKNLDPGSLHWLLSQVKGICSAIYELHKRNTRHGDLKPENILWFEDENGRGTLQIADLGLAKFHEEESHTRNRQGIKTLTPSGTSRYEPPETDKARGKDEPRSRQYDIWSMGCILLELLVWLMYDCEGLDKFSGGASRFWSKQSLEYIIDPYIDACIKVIMQELESKPSMNAYIDLLILVRDKLLVVAVSDSYESQKGYRETAEKLYESMGCIVQKNTNHPDIVRSKYPSEKVLPVHQEGGSLAVPERKDAPSTASALPIHGRSTPSIDENKPAINVHAPSGDDNLNTTKTNAPPDTIHQQHTSILDDEWKSTPDNEFAMRFINSVGWEKVKPQQPGVSPFLCTRCNELQSSLISGGEQYIADFKLMPGACDLCDLLSEALASADIHFPDTIALRQDGTTVGIKDGPDLLSIYVDPGPNLPQGTQLGLPKLVHPASSDQFALLKHWIDVCDSNHEICHRGGGHSLTMPTRLVEVSRLIRLVDSTGLPPSPYIALSHCWGPPGDSHRFCTFKGNIDQHKASIDFEDLPLTFQDAVRVVQGLGFKYIWIDSLCIIQDDDQDWQNEAARMGQVFSDAHFTIAASSAKSTNEGFLLPRTSRPCIQLSINGTRKLYVCINIDNFRRDVEAGELNSRGWVLQERALSRRSIYFSSNQVYWECGSGVHCETLTRLYNSKTAFLGDSNFPKSALEYYRDGRQVLIQDLYERYSGLAFTKPSDRAVAILGLQKRLAEAFRSQAVFGFFDIYFARGLLWKRGDNKLMRRITWPSGLHAPSWSWFSKEGPIKYMNLQFEKIEWATKDFKSPFRRHPSVTFEHPLETQGVEGLGIIDGWARKLNLTKLDMLVRITFDTKEEFNVENLRCVVIGRDKEDNGMDELKQHVLVVHPLNETTYERVGVASLRPEHLGDDGSWITIY
ncbi:hypothetical protein F5Y11DRAFT_361831 [Daldinia sp. FL1419]|nr:hypothetical protein F5Y11DRAFT_361831 [Daldinia sp. FL1419]